MTGSHSPPANLVVDTDSDAWVDELTPPGLLDDFALILQNPQEANLDIATINLLSASSIYNVWSFIQFTQEPFSKILCTFSDFQFSSFSSDKLCNAPLYGCYLVEQQLIQGDGTINIKTFDWHAFYAYWHHHHCQVGIYFNAAYHLEAKTCHDEMLAQPTCHGPPTPSPPSGPPLAHGTAVEPTVTPTPNPQIRHSAMILPPVQDDDDDTLDCQHLLCLCLMLLPITPPPICHFHCPFVSTYHDQGGYTYTKSTTYHGRSQISVLQSNIPQGHPKFHQLTEF